ncbi:hypothetical protein GCM10020331_031270 [Ectobacillus funiculus]
MLQYSSRIHLRVQKKFLDEFAASLQKADQVYLCDIFGSAREDQGELSIRDLQQRIDGSELISVMTTDVLKKKHHDAVLIFMGAGDIQKFQKKPTRRQSK